MGQAELEMDATRLKKVESLKAEGSLAYNNYRTATTAADSGGMQLALSKYLEALIQLDDVGSEGAVEEARDLRASLESNVSAVAYELGVYELSVEYAERVTRPKRRAEEAGGAKTDKLSEKHEELIKKNELRLEKCRELLKVKDSVPAAVERSAEMPRYRAAAYSHKRETFAGSDVAQSALRTKKNKKYVSDFGGSTVRAGAFSYFYGGCGDCRHIFLTMVDLAEHHRKGLVQPSQIFELLINDVDPHVFARFLLVSYLSEKLAEEKVEENSISDVGALLYYVCFSALLPPRLWEVLKEKLEVLTRAARAKLDGSSESSEWDQIFPWLCFHDSAAEMDFLRVVTEKWNEWTHYKSPSQNTWKLRVLREEYLGSSVLLDAILSEEWGVLIPPGCLEKAVKKSGDVSDIEWAELYALPTNFFQRTLVSFICRGVDGVGLEYLKQLNADWGEPETWKFNVAIADPSFYRSYEAAIASMQHNIMPFEFAEQMMGSEIVRDVLKSQPKRSLYDWTRGFFLAYGKSLRSVAREKRMARFVLLCGDFSEALDELPQDARLTKAFLSNVPDYTGLIPVFTSVVPRLRPGGAIYSNNLLNRSIWNSYSGYVFAGSYCDMKLRQPQKLFGARPTRNGEEIIDFPNSNSVTGPFFPSACWQRVDAFSTKRPIWSSVEQLHKQVTERSNAVDTGVSSFDAPPCGIAELHKSEFQDWCKSFLVHILLPAKKDAPERHPSGGSYDATLPLSLAAFYKVVLWFARENRFPLHWVSEVLDEVENGKPLVIQSQGVLPPEVFPPTKPSEQVRPKSGSSAADVSFAHMEMAGLRARIFGSPCSAGPISKYCFSDVGLGHTIHSPRCANLGLAFVHMRKAPNHKRLGTFVWSDDEDELLNEAAVDSTVLDGDIPAYVETRALDIRAALNKNRPIMITDPTSRYIVHHVITSFEYCSRSHKVQVFCPSLEFERLQRQPRTYMVLFQLPSWRAVSVPYPVKYAQKVG